MKKILMLALFTMLSLAVVRADDSTNAPALPVSVTFHKALIAVGYVATFKNKTDDTISVRLICRNPTFANGKMFNITIDPKRPQELGKLQGWAFVAGDTLELYSAGYAEKKITFTPEQ